MTDRIRNLVLIGILICLIIIALKPTPQFSVNGTPQVNIPPADSMSVTQIAPNRFAILKYDNVLIFDFNESNNTFKLVGKLDYQEYYRNLPKYDVEPVTK